MLRLPTFRYLQPSRLEEAAEILAGEGTSARPVAGGTDLWPNMKRRHQKAETVVSLMQVPDLAGIAGNGGGAGELRIGGTTILEDVARHPLVSSRYPALGRAVSSISSPPLRNMGTIGGNLCLDTRCTYYNQTEEWRRSIDYCLKEEGTICWVAPSSPRCWAHSASDSAPMLAALNARVRLVSNRGERMVAVEELFENDGIEYLAKSPDEILSDLLLPPESDASRCSSAFWKLRRRGSIDFAVLSAAVALWTADDGTIEKARVFLGAVASRPVAATACAGHLVGKKPSAENIGEAAALARKAATPMDNTDFQAQWRGLMVERYTEAALREAAGLPRERLAPPHLQLREDRT